MSNLADRLVHAVRNDAAIRRVRRLQPTGGPGDKIFPPTYPGEGRTPVPRHVFETRRVQRAAADGSTSPENVRCVLVDSVQSQANRLEEALLRARRDGAISFPAITVDFSKTAVADMGEITTLDAPHRVFDAIIRDAESEGVAFRKTAEGEKLLAAKPNVASAVFELSPNALVFGAWNSTGDGGGLGAKFPRAIVSEIVGIGVATEKTRDGEEPVPSGQRTGSRIDPLGIRSGVQVFKLPNGEWTLDAAEAGNALNEAAPGKKGKGAEAKTKDAKPKEAKALKPSEINHSNIAPTVQRLGVSVDYVLHTLVISMAALRRLHFPVNGKASHETDTLAHAALAGLALAATLAQDRAGYFLRSRCDLVPEAGSASDFEIVHADGSTEPLKVNLEDAAKAVEALAAKAAKAGLSFRAEDLKLTPMSKLVELVRRSRDKALQGEVEEGES